MEFLQEQMVTKADLMQTERHFQSEMANMSTKKDLRESELRLLDSVDEKLTNLKGDLVVLMRGEDKKVTSLIKLLREKEVLTEEETGMLLEMQPFPQS